MDMKHAPMPMGAIVRGTAVEPASRFEHLPQIFTASALPAGLHRACTSTMTVDHCDQRRVDEPAIAVQSRGALEFLSEQSQLVKEQLPREDEDRLRPVDVDVARVNLCDLVPEDGSPSSLYLQAVERLFKSIVGCGAVILDLPNGQSNVLRNASDSARLYFKYQEACNREHEPFVYRAGRPSADDSEEERIPCFPELYSCLGLVSRNVLSALARHMKLRSEYFLSLLDDCPLPCGEASSSSITATWNTSAAGAVNAFSRSPEADCEVEPGLFVLTTSGDTGLQVLRSDGMWCPIGHGTSPWSLILLPGKTLHRATGGHFRATKYRFLPSERNVNQDYRCKLAFHVLPHASATIDCSPLVSCGYEVDENTRDPILAQNFLRSLGALSDQHGKSIRTIRAPGQLHDLRQHLLPTLTDPLSGLLLLDAVIAPCGHSFASSTVACISDALLCPVCGAPAPVQSLIPNVALRAAAAALQREVSLPSSRNGPSLTLPGAAPLRFHSPPNVPPLSGPAAFFPPPVGGTAAPPAPPALTAGPLAPALPSTGLPKALKRKRDRDKDKERDAGGEGGAARPPGQVRRPAKAKTGIPQDSTAVPHPQGFPPGPPHDGQQTHLQQQAPGGAASQAAGSTAATAGAVPSGGERGGAGAGLSEGGRLKGVQFPFAVNDFVLIKGNKRTPEKFVGREAVITSQCLNGWYMVRTLDTGESVRLQYRSLQKTTPPSSATDLPASAAAFLSLDSLAALQAQRKGAAGRPAQQQPQQQQQEQAEQKPRVEGGGDGVEQQQQEHHQRHQHQQQQEQQPQQQLYPQQLEQQQSLEQSLLPSSAPVAVPTASPPFNSAAPYTSAAFSPHPMAVHASRREDPHGPQAAPCEAGMGLPEQSAAQFLAFSRVGEMSALLHSEEGEEGETEKGEAREAAEENEEEDEDSRELSTRLALLHTALQQQHEEQLREELMRRQRGEGEAELREGAKEEEWEENEESEEGRRRMAEQSFFAPQWGDSLGEQRAGEGGGERSGGSSGHSEMEAVEMELGQREEQREAAGSAPEGPAPVLKPLKKRDFFALATPPPVSLYEEDSLSVEGRESERRGGGDSGQGDGAWAEEDEAARMAAAEAELLRSLARFRGEVAAAAAAGQSVGVEERADPPARAKEEVKERSEVNPCEHGKNGKVDGQEHDCAARWEKDDGDASLPARIRAEDAGAANSRMEHGSIPLWMAQTAGPSLPGENESNHVK